MTSSNGYSFWESYAARVRFLDHTVLARDFLPGEKYHLPEPVEPAELEADNPEELAESRVAEQKNVDKVRARAALYARYETCVRELDPYAEDLDFAYKERYYLEPEMVLERGTVTPESVANGVVALHRVQTGVGPAHKQLYHWALRQETKDPEGFMQGFAWAQAHKRWIATCKQRTLLTASNLTRKLAKQITYFADELYRLAATSD